MAVAQKSMPTCTSRKTLQNNGYCGTPISPMHAGSLTLHMHWTCFACSKTVQADSLKHASPFMTGVLSKAPCNTRNWIRTKHLLLQINPCGCMNTYPCKTPNPVWRLSMVTPLQQLSRSSPNRAMYKSEEPLHWHQILAKACIWSHCMCNSRIARMQISPYILLLCKFPSLLLLQITPCAVHGNTIAMRHLSRSSPLNMHRVSLHVQLSLQLESKIAVH